MATKPEYGLPLDGRVATKRDHDAEVNRVISAVWDAAVVAQLGTPEANALLTQFQGYRDAILAARQFETVAELQASNIQGDIASVIVGDRIYVRDDTDGSVASADGKRWASLDFRGRFDRMVADMQHGATVNLIAYGDSTTDGNGTTDWTPNPVNGSNQAIGTAPHSPPAAWPRQARNALRQMFLNEKINVHNAGYSGRQLQDGWAYNNFTAAMAPYGTPTAVFISFGINDVRQAGFSPAGFEAQLLRLCRRIAKSGAFPIFITPDEPSAQQHNGWLLGKVNAIYRSVAARLGVKVIDFGTAIHQISQGGDGNDWRWASDQPDDTHGNDSWHSVKGGFIAASIYPHTLWVNEAITNIAPWGRHCKPKPGYTVFQGTMNSLGGAMVIPAAGYTTNENLLDLYVWSVGPARMMYWASVDGNGFWSPRDVADAPLVAMYDYTTKITQTIVAPGSGGAQQPDGGRDGEAMGKAFRVPQGLSRWIFRAPSDNNASDVYLGYFSIREVRPEFSQAVVLFGTAAEPRIVDKDPQGDIPQVFGMQSQRQANFALTVDLQPGLGVALWSCRVYGGSVTRENNRKRGIFLYRHPDTRLFLYSAVFNADGSIGTSTSLGSTGTLTWDGPRRLRISAGVDGSGQYIRLYDGWLSNSPAISASNALTEEPWPWGGTPGAVWQHTGSVGVAAVTIYGDI